jgi:hypothetical protein
MRSVLGVLGVTALAGVASAAIAQPSAQPSLVYVGPASCPPQAEFLRRLRVRLGAGQAVAPVQRTLDVRIAQEDRQFVGRLSLIAAEGRSTTKTLSGRKCDDLVDVLALVAALAVQADEAATPPAQPPAPPAPVPSEPVDQPQAPAPAPGLLGVWAGGVVAAGPAPAVVLGAGAGVDWAWTTPGLLSPALGLGVIAGAAPDVSRTGGHAGFAWFTARLDACAVRLAVGQVMQIRGCLVADVGLLHAHGSSTVNAQSSSRAWLALGASSQFDFPVGSRFALHVVAGVEAPLRRDRYAFGSVDFFEVPVLIATGSVGLAAHFR